MKALNSVYGGEKGGVGNTRHVGVPFPVNGDGGTSNPAGRVSQHGIDHQRPVRIVATQTESHLPVTTKPVLRANFLTNATLFLKRHGTHQPKVSRKNEVSLVIQRQHVMGWTISHPLKVETDRIGVDTRIEAEVKFQTPAVAVKDQVDPRIDLLVAHSGKSRNVHLPMARVRAAQVVAIASKPVFTADPGPGLAIDEPHSQSRDPPHRPGRFGLSCGSSGLILKDQLPVEQQVTVTGPSGKEANPIPGLSPVRFEAEGQLDIGLPNLGLADGLQRIRPTLGGIGGRRPAGPDEWPRTLPLGHRLSG